jgi:hypothetical protein
MSMLSNDDDDEGDGKLTRKLMTAKIAINLCNDNGLQCMMQWRTVQWAMDGDGNSGSGRGR